ncbi:FAD-binding protein [Arthrobacter sp. JZ12]|uniref:NAD(P)/FAD-dependent oxidoreductase n=1 Tax=Arthrobacter sp. JZ12 TaxID=2654190 RepID=UPI002B467686|nr:NAD(P)/FAD-dependent oxidoreductase [Arthrobacter sp. JZ12]WRH24148.1 FAD-binding protein [Arthrobacter sp. JZ12]
MTNEPNSYDVVVLGGGAAGLSAALMLGRTRRSVAVVDAGNPRNAPAYGVHGFLSREGMSPFELVSVGRTEVESYGGEIIQGTAVATARTNDPYYRFQTELDDGTVLRSRRLLLTTGLTDQLPDIPGLREQWGTGVLHCPFCHGWEVRDRHIGILGAGAKSVHQALLFRQWSNSITLFLNDATEPTDEELEQLAARGVNIVDGSVARVLSENDGDGLRGVELASGEVVPVEALVVAPRFVANTEIFAGLGLTPVQHPMGVGEHLAVDEMGATEVDGVWAAGNVANLMLQVLPAAASGTMAAIAINNSLMADELEQDLEAYRASRATSTIGAEVS